MYYETWHVGSINTQQSNHGYSSTAHWLLLKRPTLVRLLSLTSESLFFLWQGFPHGSSAFQRTGDFLSEKGPKFWILGSVSWWQQSGVFTGQTKKSAATFQCCSWYFFRTEVHSLEPRDRALQCYLLLFSALFLSLNWFQHFPCDASCHFYQMGFSRHFTVGTAIVMTSLAWLRQGESTGKFFFMKSEIQRGTSNKCDSFRTIQIASRNLLRDCEAKRQNAFQSLRAVRGR